ncbi:putative signal peptide and transmembrane protein [Rhodopirellula islandica]|uniref:Signal peptide and transmembrane protein n=1 Tax=Rhodopirellula islandica TaxID=595434 RepID=A0A0J1B432_RHOIS|nr:hypothetical protein [Rhodopirellula islandica]KLU01368.1 putative signal peptide and transmembrane protein [Rhodopirellula islandica]
MSRRRASLSPSLFPFLAVLVCTLGTLILLLALVAEKAQDTSVPQVAQQAGSVAPALDEPVDEDSSNGSGADSQTDADARPAMTAASADQLLEEEQFRVDQLVAHREKQTGNVERRRDELTQIQTATQKLRERLKQLSQEVEAAVTPDEAIEVDEQAIVMMREEMEALRREIEELEQVKSGDKPRVVIVPHRGPNGTARRPVYAECDEHGITIWPEDTRITYTQLLAGVQSGSPRSNPLDAALRVVRQHAMQNYGDSVPPYPLLIVRPDGIETFVAARAAMKDWDDQYGYELVPAEVDLAFPKADRVLKPKIELAVHEAANRNLHQYIGGSGSGRGDGGNGTGRGSLSGGSMLGGASQPSSGGEFANADTYSAKPSTGSAPFRGNVTDNTFSGQAAGATSQLGDPSGTSKQQTRKPLPTLSARSLDRQARANGFLAPRDAGPPLPAGGLAEPIPGSSQSSFGAVNSRSDALNDYLAQKDNPLLDDAPGNSSLPPSGAAGSMSDPSADGSDGESNADESDPDFRGSSSPVNGEQIAGMQQASGGQSASASVSQSSASPPSSNQAPDSSNQAPPSVNMQSQQQASNTVRREGKDWALPRSMAGINGTQVVRPIAMVCYHDRYELVQNNTVVATFPFENDSVYNATLKLATAVRDRVDGWGATLPGGRWQPRLDVLVAPHADQRFHELQTLMHDSGVEITRRVR